MELTQSRQLTPSVLTYRFNFLRKLKMSKYIKIALSIGCSIVLFSSCEKFLDTPPQGKYTEDTYPYPEGGTPYDRFIFAAYNDLRSYNVHVDGFVNATSIRSDDADKGSTASDGGADVISMDNFPVLATSGRANALWLGYFGLVNQTNRAMYQIDSISKEGQDEQLKIQATAEARFLRGYSYFMLVRLFGRVPKFETWSSDPATQNNIPQSSAAEIYTFVEEDLKFAAQNLPDTWDSKFIGRATKGAANGLLAKVYITQKKWQQAYDAANTVKSSGLYDLSQNYADIFSEKGENGRESIFEIQGTASPDETTKNGIQYANLQGVRGAGNWNLGWGWNTPSAALEAAYEAGDPRKARTILYSSVAGKTNVSMYNEPMPVYPADVPNPMYNHKVLSDPAMRNSISRGSWWMNIRILRYADVVLMLAESANELGKTDEARTLLNSVRERARRGAAAGVLPDVTDTDQAALRNKIRHERRIELAMEHDRFFDLVRWGTAQTALHAAGKTNFQNSRDVLLPIPQTQIDLTKGVLTQNPGY